MIANESVYIDVGTQQLHGLRWGSGKRLLLALHGYGDNAGVFRPLLEYLATDYTILSLDLPYHGDSKWNDGIAFTRKDLAEMVIRLKAEYKVEKISLAGYSMGGRVALSLIEEVPASVDKVTLLAPDGLTVNYYYYFFTRTGVGRSMFRNMLEKPGPYVAMIDRLKKMRLVDPARHKFIMHFLGSAESRNFLLRVWPATNGLIPHPGKLKSLIRQYRIPVTIFMGANDKIIPSSLAENFKKGLDTVEVHVLEKGHRVLDNESAQQIAASLL